MLRWISMSGCIFLRKMIRLERSVVSCSQGSKFGQRIYFKMPGRCIDFHSNMYNMLYFADRSGAASLCDDFCPLLLYVPTLFLQDSR